MSYRSSQMQNLVISLMAAILLPSLAVAEATGPPFSTPNEVFEAFRDAHDNHKWLDEFNCFTRSAQTNMVYELYVACAARDNDSATMAILKSHNVDPTLVGSDYENRYKQKHGVDLAKARAQSEQKLEEYRRSPVKSEKTLMDALAMPSLDQGILEEVVCARIKNKAKFYDDVSKRLFGSQDSPSRFGNLERVTVHGSTAVGFATFTSYHLEHYPNRPIKPVKDTFTKEFHFEKADGGWLITKARSTTNPSQH